MTDRDYNKLKGCEDELLQRLERVLTKMKAARHSMIVTDGFRTTAQQQAIYAKGRTTPGPDVLPSRPLGRTVTKADGVKTLSNHQSGRAADCAFLIKGKPSWGESLPWPLYGQTAEAEGLHWGGLSDKPHVEVRKEPAV